MLKKYMVWLSLLSCSSAADDRFSYEEINGIRYLSATPDNLIKMYQLSAREQAAVFKDLGYAVTKGPYDFVLKSEETGVDWQTIATQAVNKEVFRINWVSIQGNNRLKEFQRLASEPPHAYSHEQDIYLLRKDKQTYMARVSDVTLGKEVSIMAFDR